MIGGSDAATELASLIHLPNKAAAIGQSEREDRIRRAQNSLDALGVDALLVNAGPSLRYFSGVTWEPSERMVSLVIQKNGKSRMICPRFELASLDAELDVSVEILAYEEDDDPITLLADILAPETRFALDPLLPFTLALRLAARWNVVDGAGVIDGLRACKSPAELALIRQAMAMAMTLEVQRRAALILKPGIRASEVERFIDEAHRAIGSPGSTFCSVQFGSATAIPHGLPYDQELNENDLVLIDTGCTVDGYHSDLARCYAFGNVGDDIRTMRVLNKEAQAAAFAAVRPGVPMLGHRRCGKVRAGVRRTRAGLSPAGASAPHWARHRSVPARTALSCARGHVAARSGDVLFKRADDRDAGSLWDLA